MGHYTCYCAQCFEGVQPPHNDVPLNHSFCASGHCDGQNHNETGRNHTQASRDGIDDDFFVAGEAIGRKDDDGTHDGDTKEQNGEFRQFSLERGAHVHTEEGTHKVAGGQAPCLGIAMGFGGTVWLALHGASLFAGCAEGSGDGTDFRLHASGKDDSASATLGDCGGAEGDIETITSANIIVKGGLGFFADGKRLSSEKGLVRLEVHRFHQPDRR